MASHRKYVFVISRAMGYNVRVFFFNSPGQLKRRNEMMKELTMATLVAGGVCTACAGDEALPLTREWDKIFPKSGKVEH
jgi:hypothetical protein